MTFRIHMIHPKHGDLGPIENGITHRPASWPSREAAEATIAYYKTQNMWNRARDAWSYEFRVVDAKEEPCKTTETHSSG